ncbi:type I-E CRISPR-associated protein Cse2/CasB [Rubellimicrobium sp. CFH 75288]|uniref:type I-E CRISPR-associated protein Cse2/CasB n=1 Tax=Rubellimicrobium sp. CFH 75288 TaxID=2697034 RepID=UPI001412A445|nr:type I-E CRISPR-associated protein Cse2/CasB [Rubellimicrobium sp. CFH 75288]NAZ36459.1 type I-E CRISPR-associated protein Cse2/CasB [Rubellimicrobium sp. CFH 75288]
MTQDALAGAARQWWRERLRADTGEARGLCARLRRDANPVSVLSEPAVHDLARALGTAHPGLRAELGEAWAARLAALAHVLAAVEAETPEPLARLWGEGDPPRLSRLRFQRMLRETDAVTLAVSVRRALPLAGDRCNVARLAQDLLRWDEAARIRWCFDYFGGRAPEAAAPSSDGPTAQDARA